MKNSEGHHGERNQISPVFLGRENLIPGVPWSREVQERIGYSFPVAIPQVMALFSMEMVPFYSIPSDPGQVPGKGISTLPKLNFLLQVFLGAFGSHCIKLIQSRD